MAIDNRINGASREATANDKATYNATIKAAGYGDVFFSYLASASLKVLSAKRTGNTVEIKLIAFVGDDTATTIILPINKSGAPPLPETYRPNVNNAVMRIAKNNKALRTQKGIPQTLWNKATKQNAGPSRGKPAGNSTRSWRADDAKPA